MQCPTCKQMLEDGIRFCPHDGTPLVDTSATRADSTPTNHPRLGGSGTPPGGRPPVRELELPVVVGSRYRLVEPRGGGGLAQGYKARDTTPQRAGGANLIDP